MSGPVLGKGLRARVGVIVGGWLLTLASLPVLAAPPTADEAIVQARAASARGDRVRLESLAAAVPTDHPLAVYLEVWRLRSALADPRERSLGAADTAARTLIAQQGDTLAADLVRRDWAASLARRGLWREFETVATEVVLRDDAGFRCDLLSARLAAGEAVIAEARSRLMRPTALGEACQQLLVRLVERGQATADDLWWRFESALESDHSEAIRRAAAMVEPGVPERALQMALTQPATALKTHSSRTLRLISLARLARTDPVAAADWLEQQATGLRNPDRAFAWALVAAAGMRRLLPEAASWAPRAAQARASDETLAWLVRAALRAQDWPQVRTTIERMSEAGRADPAWTYWLARALLTETDRPASGHAARVLFTSLAGRPDFYSQLAAEAIGAAAVVPARAEPPTEAERAEVRALPGLARALTFYELGLRLEGHREWQFALRGLSDRRLLAVAAQMSEAGLIDRAINAADRTTREHDLAARYPTPYAENIDRLASAQGLDPAWVYGLIRQESRFMPQVRSPVGAAGLMQIMPATARWIARKRGVQDFSPGRITEIETNLQFGTFYLRTVLDQLDGSMLLASAAYNAGPGRPRSWRGSLPRAVEGAIFAEIIPFDETRGYVKHVLANTVWYAARLGREPPSLTGLLGEVSSGPVSAPTASPDGE